MKHLFIVNRAAGRGAALEAADEIRKLMKLKNEAWQIAETAYPGHAEALARNSAGYDRVYAVGGDGTVNEVANGLAERMKAGEAALAVLPFGTGNDFFRTLEPEKQPDIIRRTVDGSERRLDAASFNGRIFVNIASVGFDAAVVMNSARIRGFLSGPVIYPASVFLTLLQNPSFPFSMKIDGKPAEGRFTLLAMANGRFYGGGMQPAPQAEPDDGFLDLCLVERVTRRTVLKFFPLYKKGTHGQIREVRMHRAKHIEILSSAPFPGNMDGEVDYFTRADIRILPGALRIVMPEAF